jgi:adenylate cyclase
MRAPLKLPLLDDLAPNGFAYGGHYVVEFDTASPWYETSLTIAALALKRGLKTQYHVFQRYPSEVVEALTSFGLDARKIEKEGLLRIVDAYSETVDWQLSPKVKRRRVSSTEEPLDLSGDPAFFAKWIRSGVPEKEKGWIHLDDNSGVFLQYNDEESFLNIWRTAHLPATRAGAMAHFLAFPKGVGSDSFFTKFEALCDGIIDLKTEESAGRLERYIRIRYLKGREFDSRWHRLDVQPNGEVLVVRAASGVETRRLSAIMFTDMVGYTAAVQVNEKAALALRKEQEDLVHPLLAKHQGRKVKSTGDGFLAEFDSALKATECAVDLQRRLNERNARGGVASLQIRIGIHLGDVEQQGADIFGDAVNIAARIEHVAEPGGVCLSSAVRDQVWNKIPEKLEKLPPIGLKGLQEKSDVFRVVFPWSGPSPMRTTLEPTRLAVLPFVNISPDPNDGYFADGLTEELIGKLSEVRGLRVIARTSVMNYKQKERRLVEIGAELGVGSVIEGSVRRSGDRIRITAQLIDARTEEQLWAGKYDSALTDIFAIQTDVASKVAGSLVATGLARSTQKDTPDLEVYTSYLHAMVLLHTRDRASLREAIALLERAIERDPTYARAYSALARALFLASDIGAEEWTLANDRARVAARRALELAPDLAEAHAAMAVAQGMADRHGEAIAEAERAISINPNLMEAHAQLGVLLLAVGSIDRALAAHRRAYELDPLSITTALALARVAQSAGQTDEAWETLQRIDRLSPKNPSVCRGFAEYYSRKGEYSKALEVVGAGQKVSPDVQGLEQFRGEVYARMGRRSEAEQILRNLEQTTQDPIHRCAIRFWIRAALGDLDDAFDSLARLAEVHYWSPMIMIDPQFAQMREDPRFAAFRVQVGLTT